MNPMKSLIHRTDVNGQRKQLSDWNQINWKKTRKIVNNLRKRIFRARKLGQWKQLRRLQKLLFKSYANLLLAVRQITQLNTGKNTAGVDKEVINTPKKKGRTC
jgi:RNA-directed DNA polymerase